MNHLLLSAAQEVAKMAEPAVSTLAQTVIGSLLILSWLIAIVAVWQLIKVQNARIVDKTDDSKRIERLNEKLVTITLEFKNSMDSLTSAEKESHQLLTSLKQSHDTIILTAIQKSRSVRPRRDEGGE